jgi:hypothetical protein
MKSPENHTDDGLRDALKRRFDDFEMKPDPMLKKNIFAALRVWQKDKNFQRNWIVFLTLAILFTGTLFHRSSRNPVVKEMPHSAKVNTNRLPEAAKPALAAAAVETKHIAENRVAAKSVGLVEKSSIVKQTGPVTSIEVQHNLETNRNVAVPSERTIDPTPNLPDRENINALEAVDKEVINEDPGSKVEENLALLDNLPAHFASPLMQVPEPVLLDSSYFVKSKTANHGWTILAGVTPVKTFQVLNVISNPGFIYRNFQFPRSASLETLGYKLNAGIGKNGFEFLISYSHYRQSVRYEQAGDEFEILPGGTNDAQVRRKFTAVNSDRTLRLVGLGVRKQFVPRAPAFRDFYASIGTELSTELTQGGTMAWLNAGIGRQVMVGKSGTLQVGPYFEYGFTKLLSREGAFQVKPYQVGLSIILKNSFKGR